MSPAPVAVVAATLAVIFVAIAGLPVAWQRARAKGVKLFSIGDTLRACIGAALFGLAAGVVGPTPPVSTAVVLAVLGIPLCGVVDAAAWVLRRSNVELADEPSVEAARVHRAATKWLGVSTAASVAFVAYAYWVFGAPALALIPVMTLGSAIAFVAVQVAASAYIRFVLPPGDPTE